MQPVAWSKRERLELLKWVMAWGPVEGAEEGGGVGVAWDPLRTSLPQILQSKPASQLTRVYLVREDKGGSGAGGGGGMVRGGGDWGGGAGGGWAGVYLVREGDAAVGGGGVLGLRVG